MVDPDMRAATMRLHMGEMNADEVRTARAAIRWANSRKLITMQETLQQVQEALMPFKAGGILPSDTHMSEVRIFMPQYFALVKATTLINKVLDTY